MVEFDFFVKVFIGWKLYFGASGFRPEKGFRGVHVGFIRGNLTGRGFSSEPTPKPARNSSQNLNPNLAIRGRRRGIPVAAFTFI